MIVLRDSVLVDIDHTISDAFWRDPMQGTASWDDYHAASVEDKPIPEMVELLRNLSLTGYQILGFTARPEKFRKLTMDWCLKHDVQLHELLMRPDNCFRPAPEIKLELAQKRFGHEVMKHAIAFIIDDREDVCAAFKAIGITALCIHARRSDP